MAAGMAGLFGSADKRAHAFRYAVIPAKAVNQSVPRIPGFRLSPE